MNQSEKLSVYQIQIEPLPALVSGELSDEVICKCFFCEKSTDYQLVDKFSNHGIYCVNCIRNNFHTKNSKDILILSFRSIIGHLYFQNYLNFQGIGHKLWLSEIEDFIISHQNAGLINPVFIYDSETMLWFIDFKKIGNSKRKIAIEEVLKTIISILTSFNLTELVPGVNMSETYQKYKNAIENFYHKRQRPENRRMLIPSLVNPLESKTFGIDRLRNFIFENLKPKK